MIYPYLNFNGNTREAIAFYASVFDLQDPQIMTFGEGPQVPPEMKDWVMHAQLIINGTRVMFSDAMINDPVDLGNNLSLMMIHEDAALLETWFNRLSVGAEIWQPLQKTFFSPLYGSLKDKFGVVWQFNCEPKA
mgnify:CR=1 FL=1